MRVDWQGRFLGCCRIRQGLYVSGGNMEPGHAYNQSYGFIDLL